MKTPKQSADELVEKILREETPSEESKTAIQLDLMRSYDKARNYPHGLGRIIAQLIQLLEYRSEVAKAINSPEHEIAKETFKAINNDIKKLLGL